MKKYILLFAFMIPLLFVSCSEEGTEMSDDEIIQAIIDSDKILVSDSDLPLSAMNSIEFEMPNDFIESGIL